MWHLTSSLVTVEDFFLHSYYSCESCFVECIRDHRIQRLGRGVPGRWSPGNDRRPLRRRGLGLTVQSQIEGNERQGRHRAGGQHTRKGPHPLWFRYCPGRRSQKS